jgi:hypothetical protein
MTSCHKCVGLVLLNKKEEEEEKNVKTISACSESTSRDQIPLKKKAH